jgi:hypothetical protein
MQPVEASGDNVFGDEIGEAAVPPQLTANDTWVIGLGASDMTVEEQRDYLTGLGLVEGRDFVIHADGSDKSVAVITLNAENLGSLSKVTEIGSSILETAGQGGFFANGLVLSGQHSITDFQILDQKDGGYSMSEGGLNFLFTDDPIATDQSNVALISNGSDGLAIGIGAFDTLENTDPVGQQSMGLNLQLSDGSSVESLVKS